MHARHFQKKMEKLLIIKYFKRLIWPPPKKEFVYGLGDKIQVIKVFDNEFEIVEKENVNKNVDVHKSAREKELMENEYYDIEKSNVKK